jgi:hypothetical protein
MKLCYLINQYPTVSNSFIRRETLELENEGAEVLRIESTAQLLDAFSCAAAIK